MKEYYIICKRHMKTKDFAFTFWGPNNSGYVFDLNNAGIYTKEQVDKQFPESHWSDDMPIDTDIVNNLKKAYVIDNSRLGYIVINNQKNRRILKTKKKELVQISCSSWDERAFKTPQHFMNMTKNVDIIRQQILSIEIKK